MSVLDWSEWPLLTEIGWKTYDWCSINLNLEKPSRSIYYNGNGGDGADVTWNFTDGDYFSFPTVIKKRLYLGRMVG